MPGWLSRLWVRTRTSLPYASALSPLIPAFVIGISFHYFFIRSPGPVGFDDGYSVALGERLLDRSLLPYVDGASHRGPMLYWLTAITQATFGRFSWEGARWLVFLTSMTTLVGLAGIGIAARAPLMGAVSALCWVWIAMVSHDPGATFAVNGEPIAGALLVVALFAVTWGLLRARPGTRRLGWLFASGVACGLAGFTKQTAFPLYAPLLGWVLVACLVQPGSTWRLAVSSGLASLFGFVAPALIIVARYAVAGELSTFWYWFYTYNAEVYMDPFRETPFKEAFDTVIRDIPVPFAVVCLLIIFSLVRPVFDSSGWRGFWKAYARHGLETTVALCATAAFISLASPKRFWTSYHLLLYPFLGLLIGLRASALFTQTSGSPRARTMGHLLLAGLLSLWAGYTGNLKLRQLVAARNSGAWQAGSSDPMCPIIARYTDKGDAIFVWGFEADLYVSCQRHLASRFAYLTLVAGTVPPHWTDVRPERVARGAREQLLDDLQEARPKVILDVPARMGNVSLRTVPELVSYVDGAYCIPELERLPRLGTLYLRRDQPGCATAPRDNKRFRGSVPLVK